MLLDPSAARKGEKPNIKASAISILANLPMVFFWKINKVIEAKKYDLFWSLYWQMII